MSLFTMTKINPPAEAVGLHDMRKTGYSPHKKKNILFQHFHCLNNLNNKLQRLKVTRIYCAALFSQEKDKIMYIETFRTALAVENVLSNLLLFHGQFPWPSESALATRTHILRTRLIIPYVFGAVNVALTVNCIYFS